MGDSSDEECVSEWIPYSKRPNWQDVKPLEQDDGVNPVAVIAYSERCKWLLLLVVFSTRFVSIRKLNSSDLSTVKDVYNYFRAIISSGEKSERALHLTDDALKLNASNYTVWQYR